MSKGLVKDWAGFMAAWEALQAAAAEHFAQITTLDTPPPMEPGFWWFWNGSGDDEVMALKSAAGIAAKRVYRPEPMPEFPEGETYDEGHSIVGEWFANFVSERNNLQIQAGNISTQLAALAAIIAEAKEWTEGAGKKAIPAAAQQLPRIGVGAKQTLPQQNEKGERDAGSAKRAEARFRAKANTAKTAANRARQALQRAQAQWRNGKISAAKLARIQSRAARREAEASRARQAHNTAKGFLI